MIDFILDTVLRILGFAVVVYIVAAFLPGMKLSNFKTAIMVAVVFGVLNFILFKVLILITFPLLLLKWITLGLFGVVINAWLLRITSGFLDDFEIDGFGTAFGPAVVSARAHLLGRLLGS